MAWVEKWDREPAVEACQQCDEAGYVDELMAEESKVKSLHMVTEYGNDRWICWDCIKAEEMQRKYVAHLRFRKAPKTVGHSERQMSFDL